MKTKTASNEKPQHSPLPATIHDMLNSRGWDCFISDRLGNDLFLSDPDRAKRIHKAAYYGADGSTHGERINDWRDYVEQLRADACRESYKVDDADEDKAEVEINAWHDRITAEIDACEARHEANGSLHAQRS